MQPAIAEGKGKIFRNTAVTLHVICFALLHADGSSHLSGTFFAVLKSHLHQRCAQTQHGCGKKAKGGPKRVKPEYKESVENRDPK